MATPTLKLLIQGSAPLSDIAAHSDALSQEARIEQVRALSAKDLRGLWELARSTAPISISFLVPASTPPGHTVEWVGKNSLAMFNLFTKRFTRSPDPHALTGHNTGRWQWVVGPGYFTATSAAARPGELELDYTRYPPKAPEGWPKFKTNDAGIRWIAFHGMHDFVRAVGAHLAIGAAFKQSGEFRGQYFALARGATLPIGAGGEQRHAHEEREPLPAST